MKEIDWSKAPEGFPLWLEGTNEEHRKNSGWYRRAGQVFEGAHGGQWRAVREGQFFTVHESPESSPWTGVGLPPASYLHERLRYDAATGSLVWLPRPQTDFTEKHHFASWVARCEGKEAGVVVTKKRKKYRRIDICGRKIYAHRIAWAMYYGQHPDAEIDHKNGNSLDNSIMNLRKVSHQTNSQNAMLQAKSRSGYCGVNWHAETGKWRARVKINGREKYIGLFDDPVEAANRIKAVRDALGFHENHGSSIRTPEQIAAEERSKAIDELRSDGEDAGVYINQPQAAALYDAGYRKQPTQEETK